MLKTAFEKLFQIRESASRARPGADEGFDAHEKPFLDHLEDLRTTLMQIGATLAIATIVCFAFHTKIYELIKIPAKLPMAQISEGVSLWSKLELITLSPPEFIVLMLKLSFFSGVIISFPFTIYFLFQFIIPGMRQVEKRTIIPGALIGFILFLAGVCFAFFLAAPVALKFFYVFENERIGSIDPTAEAMELPIREISLMGPDGQVIPPVGEKDELETPKESLKPEAKSKLSPEMKQEIRDYIRGSFATIDGSKFALRHDETRDKMVLVEVKGGTSIYRIGDYINFIARLVLVFGISFQLPVVVTILVKLDLLTARVMRSTRTYAWIIILVSAAILTPPDLMTLGLLGGPMIILYEICIIIASIIERRREKKERAEEEARKSRLQRLYEKPADELSEEEKAEIHKAEIEQYEREHAHLYDHDSDHPDHESGDSDTVARDSFHGDPYHGGDDEHMQHDESWHEDDHYWHDGHEDDPHHNDPFPNDPHHGEEPHEPVQDWPDRDDSAHGGVDAGDKDKDKEDSVEMESDHAEPVDLEPGEEGDESVGEEDAPETSKAESSEEAHNDEDDLFDSDGCAPDGPVVDMNHATKEELLTLPGVDEELADSIIDHRPYETFDDLGIVPGLDDDKINAMIHRLMLG